MKNFLFSVLALAGALLWGCEDPNEEQPIDYNSQALKIAATIEQSRTSVTSSSVAWAAGDEIKLVCESEEYAFSTATAGESAEFTSTSEITPATIEGCAVMAYYGCNSLGAYTIAQNQSVVGGVNQTKVPMYAYTTEAPEQAVLPLTFKPAASVLEVSFGSKAITVESISLSPAAGALVTGGGICGTFNVNALTGKVSAKNTLETITVTFDQSQNLENGLSVQIPIGWCTITGGLKLSISYNDGSLYEDVLWVDETVSTYAEVDGVQTYKYFVAEVEIDLGPRDWYVKADGNANAKGWNWEKPTTLSNALVNAAAGSTIHIAAGTYTPENYILGADGTNDVHKTFEVSKGLTLIGGYPADATTGAVADATNNASVLDGTLDTTLEAEVYAYHVLLVTSPEKVVLEGLTIQGGNNLTATIEPDKETGLGVVTSAINEVSIEDKSGAGIYIATSEVEMNNCVVCDNKGIQGVGVFAKDATLTINNSTFTRNANNGNGGGVMQWNGTLTIESSTLDNNGLEGTTGVGCGLLLYAHTDDSAVATIKNTSISGNIAAAANGNQTGVYVYGKDETANLTATFTNCNISDNQGGMGTGWGVYCATATFDGCKFNNNAAGGNGVFYVRENATVTILNSEFVGNSSTAMGGIYCVPNDTQSSLYVANTLFLNNKSTGRGGASYLRKNSSATFVNCTFSGNTATSYGSAIALNETGVTANIISCTFSENSGSHKSYSGALSTENNDCTLNIYNSIISGNTNTGGNTNVDIHVKTGVTPTITYKNVVVGDKVYGADGAVVEDKTFNAEELGAYAEGVYPVATTSVAYTDGMSASDLFTLGSGINADLYTEAIMSADQKGNARTGNVMGAYVGQ